MSATSQVMEPPASTFGGGELVTLTQRDENSQVPDTSGPIHGPIDWVPPVIKTLSCSMSKSPAAYTRGLGAGPTLEVRFTHAPLEKTHVTLLGP